MWNTQSNGTNNTATTDSTIIKCNSKEYDVTGTNGIALIERLKTIARDNQISKFDIFDSTGDSLTTEEVENSDFTSPLSIVRFNVAA